MRKALRSSPKPRRFFTRSRWDSPRLTLRHGQSRSDDHRRIGALFDGDLGQRPSCTELFGQLCQLSIRNGRRCSLPIRLDQESGFIENLDDAPTLGLIGFGLNDDAVAILDGFDVLLKPLANG